MARRASSTGAAGEEPAQSRLVRAAERMVAQIESLVAEVTALRDSNASLRQELREALGAFERSSAVLAQGRPRGRPRRVTPAVDGETRPAAAPAAAVGRRKRRATGAKGRATPAAVTTDVVRAVLSKLGEATASEIAAEITTAGVPVSGRAVRFLAEAAGATTTVGPDGYRRYRLS